MGLGWDLGGFRVLDRPWPRQLFGKASKNFLIGGPPFGCTKGSQKGTKQPQLDNG